MSTEQQTNQPGGESCAPKQQPQEGQPEKEPQYKGDDIDRAMVANQPCQKARPSDQPQFHNPDKLTPEQVGDGWRLFVVGETAELGDELWVRVTKHWIPSHAEGDSKHMAKGRSYRTKRPLPSPVDPPPESVTKPQVSDFAKEAAEVLTDCIEQVSKSLNGPRFAFEEFTNDLETTLKPFFLECHATATAPLEKQLADAKREAQKLRPERDKLLGFYTEIVKELGDDLVLPRISALRQKLDEAKKVIAIYQNVAPEDIDIVTSDCWSAVAEAREEVAKWQRETESANAAYVTAREENASLKEQLAFMAELEHQLKLRDERVKELEKSQKNHVAWLLSERETTDKQRDQLTAKDAELAELRKISHVEYAVEQAGRLGQSIADLTKERDEARAEVERVKKQSARIQFDYEHDARVVLFEEVKSQRDQLRAEVERLKAVIREGKVSVTPLIPGEFPQTLKEVVTERDQLRTEVERLKQICDDYKNLAYRFVPACDGCQSGRSRIMILGTERDQLRQSERALLEEIERLKSRLAEIDDLPQTSIVKVIEERDLLKHQVKCLDEDVNRLAKSLGSSRMQYYEERRKLEASERQNAAMRSALTQLNMGLLGFPHLKQIAFDALQPDAGQSFVSREEHEKVKLEVERLKSVQENSNTLHLAASNEIAALMQKLEEQIDEARKFLRDSAQPFDDAYTKLDAIRKAVETDKAKSPKEAR